jgi:hypothetical protein
VQSQFAEARVPLGFVPNVFVNDPFQSDGTCALVGIPSLHVRTERGIDIAPICAGRS